MNSCISYTLKDIDSLTNEIEAKFPILFNNIDGAASNFDSFTTELGLCRTEFSIIGIAETNLDEEHRKLQGRSQDVSLRGDSVRAGDVVTFLGERSESVTPAAGEKILGLTTRKTS